ncbi:MAG: AraC family transcriptional regulator [Myxococcales bacterium]|nr:AraC family transcriptional regulator [Myxococcales bacterium]
MQISIVMVRALIGAVERAGVTRERFLREAELDAGALENGATWLTVEDYTRILMLARVLTAAPALGLHIGEHSRAVMLDTIGPLLEHVATLREAFASMGRYSRLLSVGHEPELHERGDSAWLRFPSLRGPGPFVEVTAEWTMAAMVPFLRLFAGERASPRSVSFAYPAPAHRAEYGRLFGGVERFERTFTQLEMPRAWLDEAQPYRSAEVYASLKSQADRALRRIERAGSVRARIEQVLTKQQAGTGITLAQVARQLQMSERSLHRRMRAEGVSFRTLLADGRRRRAKRMLEQPGTSIQETAFALGFTTPTAFHRAFKRWTGVTPRQYRDSL